MHGRVPLSFFSWYEAERREVALHHRDIKKIIPYLVPLQFGQQVRWVVSGEIPNQKVAVGAEHRCLTKNFVLTFKFRS